MIDAVHCCLWRTTGNRKAGIWAFPISIARLLGFNPLWAYHLTLFNTANSVYSWNGATAERGGISHSK